MKDYCPIAVLSEDVINKIAAGEVIERPASIVRELVDNAIDAKANSVSVEIIEGGQTLIKVSDNGQGMSEQQAVLSFHRHATSKISNISDLESIGTLGFRGEALSSIAAVSDVKLKTKQENSGLGIELQLKDGKLFSQKACSANRGSEFEITKLFVNLPARRKFLKSPRSDLTRIQDWLYQSALSNPTVRYKLVADGREIFRLSEHTDIFKRLESLLDGTTIRVDFKAGPFSVRGLIAHPSQANFKAGGLIFILNGRPIQDRILMKSTRDAWSSALRPGEAPIGALEITLPPTEVDINVHPQKSEVRFRNGQAVFASLHKSIKAGLSEWKPASSFSNDSYIQKYSNASVKIAFDESPALFSQGLYDTSSQSVPHLQVAESISQLHLVSNQPFVSERYVGQILGVFLIFERAGKTFLVDAHAAHERVRYNELLKWAELKQDQSQALLFPEKIEMSAHQIACLMEKQTDLEKFGLRFRVDSLSLLVYEIPNTLRITDLPSLLENLAEVEVQDIQESLKKAIEKTLARSACRSSVMSGLRLEPPEAITLWEKIKTEPQGAVCPHGRPVMIELSRAEVDKMFFRDGF